MAGIYGGGATLDDLNDWLQTITGLTFDSRAYLESISKRSGGTGGGGSGSGAGPSRDWPQRLDDAIERFGRRIETAIGRLGSFALSQTQQLTRRGFGGTVEGARFDYAMEQLSRQMAAVFMPILNGMTYLAARVEREMRGMTGGQQNQVMGGLIGAGVGMRLAGGLGVIPGAFLGAGLMAQGGDQTSGLIGAAAGGLIGARMGGLPGAAAGAAAGYIAERGDYGRLRASGEGRGASFAGAAAATLGDMADVGSAVFPLTAPAYWGARALGFEGFGATARHAMGADITGTTIGLGAAGARDPHRDVTPFQAQMGEAGSGFFRMQESMIRVTAGAEFQADAGPLKPIIDLLIECVQWLRTLAGGGGGAIDAPASAMRAAST